MSQPCFKLNTSDLQVKQQEFVFTLFLFSVNHDMIFFLGSSICFIFVGYYAILTLSETPVVYCDIPAKGQC